MCVQAEQNTPQRICYIATYYQYDNYGTRLQNYALCRVLEACNVQPITLALIDGGTVVKRLLKNFLSLLPEQWGHVSHYRVDRYKRQMFARFNKHLNLLPIRSSQLSKLDFTHACAIAGSDQIWSPKHLSVNPHDADLFFLRFVPQNKRFAYAPSFGSADVPEWYGLRYAQYITEFNKLSVREETGRDIIQSLIGRDAQVMPDPTFLLSRDEWKQLTESTKPPVTVSDKSFALVYFLSEQSTEVRSHIAAYAKTRGLRIISIAGNQVLDGDIIATPDVFVSLIRHAVTVFTDSFHAAVFSIIMQTPFVVFRRTDVDQISRLQTLLRTYRLECALAETVTDVSAFDRIIKQEEFHVTEQLMAAERRRGLNYIDRCLAN